MIPVLSAHDPRKAIGMFVDGEVTLLEPISQETVFAIFGNCGCRAIESETKDGIVYVKKFQIFEWSFGA
jgi:hypothetical protein